ncbi:MAG: NADH-quinone oxidoreductase subunit L [Candidatus Eisenbacteria bacterium]|uniref:NADH-quinone oxidoreductase subunit L n=1 Tax=Eiseniibacteriota bacterium TaxID=2212470 RepID=A0A956N906_UNCEI|nr:NADH-quinone oxidoreductase subunit L [Candidatus Eisenbacteria bacterium]
MNEAAYLWLIPALPLIGSVIAGLVTLLTSHKEIHHPPKVVGWISSLAVLGSFLITVQGFLALRGLEPANRFLELTLFEWMAIGPLNLNMGFLLDPLSSTMLLFVTGIAFLIHVYSIGYMSHDRGFTRFFAYLNLFTFAMILLVLGDNLIVLFVGWEGVGLCSYLLIGFWHTKTENAVAGMKAFVVNRIGDFGFLLGMFVIFWTLLSQHGTPTFDFRLMQSQAHLIPAGAAALAGILLFVGATGKSAQIPLFVWLPDAMAGPTPVSALIHAATMVTAGVYMVARMNWLYEMTPLPLTIIAIVAALTALMSATIGLTQFDIKKVLAYSTVSQLGYMFLACGVGAYAVGIFHVLTHAFFKALMFLGSGSVIHALHEEQDMRKMGGLFKKIPITGWTFLAGWLAICGIVPFAGFFSKDEILWKAWSSHNELIPWLPKALWVLGFLTAGLTALYMTRLVAMTFFGKSRVEPEKEHHIHESPWTMTLPLVVLAIGSLTVGFLGTPEFLGLGPNRFHAWLEPVFSGELYAVQAPGSRQSIDLAEQRAHGTDSPFVFADGDENATFRTVQDEHGHQPTETQTDAHGSAGTDAGTEHGTDAHATPAGTDAHGSVDAHGAAAASHGGAAAHGGGHGEHDTTMEWILMFASLGMAALGIAIGLFLYLRSPATPVSIAAGFGGLYALVRDKYRVDELYDATIIRPLVGISRSFLWKVIDVRVIDFIVNFVGLAAKGTSFIFRFFQSGYVQAYAFVILLGLAVILFRVF